jgi:ferredoxin
MTYVVTDACVLCKHTDCVEVCPVDCFHEGPNFLAIDPESCIDCSLCVAECPVGAIYSDINIPEDMADYIQINEGLSKIWPVIVTKKDPLPNHEHWAKITNKLDKIEQ